MLLPLLHLTTVQRRKSDPQYCASLKTHPISFFVSKETDLVVIIENGTKEEYILQLSEGV